MSVLLVHQLCSASALYHIESYSLLSIEIIFLTKATNYFNMYHEE